MPPESAHAQHAHLLARFVQLGGALGQRPQQQMSPQVAEQMQAQLMMHARAQEGIDILASVANQAELLALSQGQLDPSTAAQLLQQECMAEYRGQPQEGNRQAGCSRKRKAELQEEEPADGSAAAEAALSGGHGLAAPCAKRGKRVPPSKNCGCPQQKQPCFGFTGERPTACKACKAQGMVNLISASCVCGKAQPNFGLPGQGPPRHCKTCKEPQMVNVRGQKCSVCKGKRPNYGQPGTRNATHCAGCAKKQPQLGLVDVKNKKCFCGKKQPKFGYPGSKHASHCAGCRLEGMIDIMNPKCHCGKHAPTFGKAKGAKATHCASCREDGMVDVRKT